MFLVLISSVLLLTTVYPQDVCVPDDDFIDNLKSLDSGSKLNLTFTDPSLSIITCAALETRNQTSWTGRNLILSDSPEYPSTRGKLYEDDTLPKTPSDEPNRIFLYHVNGNADINMKFAIFVTNQHQSDSATLTVVQKGVSDPTKNYIISGQRAFHSWLKSEMNDNQIIQPLESVQMDVGYYRFDVQPDELLHGIYDYHITQSHKLTICALEPEDDPRICLNLPVFPRDRHVRGTFQLSEKRIDVTHNISTSIVQQFPLADGVTDEFVTGVDQTDGSIQINSGNYGVLYRVNLNIISTTLQNLNHSEVAYVINPRGGIYAGAVGIVGEESFLLPVAESGILRNNFEGAIIGKFRNGMNPSIIWMPTGGSNLPIRIAGIRYLTGTDSVPSVASNQNTIYRISIVSIFLLLRICGSV